MRERLDCTAIATRDDAEEILWALWIKEMNSESDVAMDVHCQSSTQYNGRDEVFSR